MNLTPATYACGCCERSFVSAAARFEHMQTAHGLPPEERLRLTQGAAEAHAHLQDVLARTAAKHAGLLARRAGRQS